MDNSIVTVLLVICIAGVIAIMGFAAFYFTQDSNNNPAGTQVSASQNVTSVDSATVNDVETPENVVDDNTTIDDNQNVVTDDNTAAVDTNIVDTDVESDVVTLDKIVEKYNNSSAVMEWRSNGDMSVATVDENKILIKTMSLDYSFDVVFTLDGTILTGEVYNEGDNDAVITSKAKVLPVVLDSVACVKGFQEKALQTLIDSDASKNYTLENEGILIEADSTKIIMKIDISKDLSFVNQ